MQAAREAGSSAVAAAVAAELGLCSSLSGAALNPIPTRTKGEGPMARPYVSRGSELSRICGIYSPAPPPAPTRATSASFSSLLERFRPMAGRARWARLRRYGNRKVALTRLAGARLAGPAPRLHFPPPPRRKLAWPS